MGKAREMRRREGEMRRERENARSQSSCSLSLLLSFVIIADLFVLCLPIGAVG